MKLILNHTKTILCSKSNYVLKQPSTNWMLVCPLAAHNHLYKEGS